MSRQTRRTQITPAEQLELRVLPTVNVTLNPNTGLLKVTGDNNANRVSIEGTSHAGQIEVFVEGNSVGLFDGVRSITANMKGGDDTLLLAAIQIEGGVNAKLGSGADELDIDATATNVNQPVFIGGTLIANLGGNAGDLLDFDDTIHVIGDATFTGVADADMNGDGVSSDPELNKDIVFFSDLTIRLSGEGDSNGDDLEIDLDNVVVGGTTIIDGSDDIERIEMTSSFFQGEFNANLDDGNDVIDINNGLAQRNAFGLANFRGGDDLDTLFKGIDNVFGNPPQIFGFETVV